jgi:hypothetical protein
VLQNDRSGPHRSNHLAPFPSEMLEGEDYEAITDIRAASTGALLDEKEPLVSTHPLYTAIGLTLSLQH